MGRNRAWRRFQKSRIEKKAYKKFKLNPYYIDSRETVDNLNKDLLNQAKRLKEHMAICSCMACGNPRYHWKKVTIQELKALDDFKSQEF